MFKKKYIISFLLIATIFSSCKIVHALTELHRRDAKEYNYKRDDKDITFIPMHHLGKKEFYDDVKKRVTDYKSKGYIVYYELVSTDVKLDSLSKDSLRRKARRIIGFSGSYKDKAKGTFLDKYVAQPSYSLLGTTEKDKRADVNMQQLIGEWENVNGEIKLDSMDLFTPFDSTYEKDHNFSRKQFENVFIGYRNNYLISLIDSSKENKILILYGEGHRKDFGKKISR